MKTCKKIPSSETAAFSLVEVALAMGIISFCLLTLLGLMPAGLDALRDAGQQTAQTQIVQQIASQAQLMPHAELAQYVSASKSTPYFYDESGLKLENKNDQVRYEAVLEDLVTKYPGSDGATDLRKNISTIKVSIKPINSRQKSYHVIHVPNTQG